MRALPARGATASWQGDPAPCRFVADQKLEQCRAVQSGLPLETLQQLQCFWAQTHVNSVPAHRGTSPLSLFGWSAARLHRIARAWVLPAAPGPSGSPGVPSLHTTCVRTIIATNSRAETPFLAAIFSGFPAECRRGTDFVSTAEAAIGPCDGWYVFLKVGQARRLQAFRREV